MPERAPLALWATPAHASLMASMTTDGVLAVYDDGVQVCAAQSCSVPEMDLIGFSILQAMAKRTH